MASFICGRCLRPSGLPASSRRKISSTAAQRRAVPSLSPSSSPQLDEIFQSFRDRIFIPDSLSSQHRHLVYRPKNKTVLTNERGVTVALSDDEEVRLQPQDHSDRPNKREVFVKIPKLLAEARDDSAWRNTLPFIEGLNHSKTNIPALFPIHIIGAAAKAGKLRHIIRLFEQADKTGWGLHQHSLVWAFFRGCHDRAAEAGFKGEETDTVAREVEQVARLLERRDHRDGLYQIRNSTEKAVDSRLSIIVVSVLLELSAATAVNHHGAKDVDGKVANYLSKILLLTEKGIEDGTSPFIWCQPKSAKNQIAEYQERSTLRILQNALELAAQVDGVPASQQQEAFDSQKIRGAGGEKKTFT
ncbi:hypothetical protein DV735_g3085, partial [Chaetothyriales sp. CBS 134920]